jgi:energy-coupling factor transporter ATP-binding protein EcfA2
VIEERVAPFTLPSPSRPLAPPLLQLEGASVGYDGKAVLRDLNLRLDVDDRIGLLGVNGAGKSTFAKMVAGALALQSGHLKSDGRIRVGWFHQHQIEALDPADTPLDIIRRARPDDSESSRRSRLAQFGLSFDKQETTVADLSGGERARLLLNLVAMVAPHLLILDEPTNHLDIDSRRALLEAPERLRRSGHPHHARSLADRLGGRPAVARRRRSHKAVPWRHGRLRSLRPRAREGGHPRPFAASRSQRRPGAAIGKAASEALGRRRRIRPAGTRVNSPRHGSGGFIERESRRSR